MHVKIASRIVCIVSHVRKQKSVVGRLFCRWTVTCVVSGCREALATAAGAPRTRSPRTAACSRRRPSGQSGHGSVNRLLPVLGAVPVVSLVMGQSIDCCLFWARFYGNHLLCIYVGVKILYLASALLQVSQRKYVQPYCAPTSPARLLMGALVRAAYIHQTLPYHLTNISEQTQFSNF